MQKWAIGFKRNVNLAVRINGPLNVDDLRQSLQQLAGRHDALRTHIALIDGTPTQIIEGQPDVHLDITDLGTAGESAAEAAARELLQQFVNESIDCEKDPLFACKLLRLGPRAHVFALALEHLIADTVSLAILRRELELIYAHVSIGTSPPLSPLPLQFADYSQWLHDTQAERTRLHWPWWSRRLAGAKRVRLPRDGTGLQSTKLSLAQRQIFFGSSLSNELRQVSRSVRIPVALCVLALYMTVVLRWSGENDLTLPFSVHGRPVPQLEHAIGWFAYALFLRLQYSDEDTLLNILKRMGDEYCSAYAHQDMGLVQATRPLCEKNGSFIWYFDLAPASRNPLIPNPGLRGTTIERFLFPGIRYQVDLAPDADQSSIDWEPGVQFWDMPQGITGCMSYNPELLTSSSIDRFCQDLASFADVLVKDGNARVSTLPHGPMSHA